MEKLQLSVIGLGKLGSPMAAVFAQKGFSVIGLDINKDYVSSINSGIAPVKETQLQEYIDQGRDRLRATMNYDEAIQQSQVSFIILPTPSQDDGFFSNEFVLQAIKCIGQSLTKKNQYHLVVITSTTMPGSTTGVIRETLEKESGRTLGDNLGLCYSPEFIALGSVIKDMLHPDFILIGESDEQAGSLLESIYLQTCDNTPTIKRMSFTSAELTKIAVNTFVTTKISYANMLAEYCDHLEDADADVVMDAVGTDSRIGKKYLKAALGYGGPCFPRDNKAFSALGRQLGVKRDLAEATDSINDHQVTRLINAIQKLANPSASISILGLSYKPNTDVVDESQGIQLANSLCKADYKITVFDPMSMKSSEKWLNPTINRASSLADAVLCSEVIVITTPWKAFEDITSLTQKINQEVMLIDPWRLVNQNELKENIMLVTMGKKQY